MSFDMQTPKILKLNLLSTLYPLMRTEAYSFFVVLRERPLFIGVHAQSNHCFVVYKLDDGVCYECTYTIVHKVRAEDGAQ